MPPDKKASEIERFVKLANVVLDPRIHKNLKKCILCSEKVEKVMGNKCIRICVGCNAMYFMGEEDATTESERQLERQSKDDGL